MLVWLFLGRHDTNNYLPQIGNDNRPKWVHWSPVWQLTQFIWGYLQEDGGGLLVRDDPKKISPQHEWQFTKAATLVLSTFLADSSTDWWISSRHVSSLEKSPPGSLALSLLYCLYSLLGRGRGGAGEANIMWTLYVSASPDLRSLFPKSREPPCRMECWNLEEVAA